MRPDALLPLFVPLTTLPGVGPKLAKPVAKAVGGDRVLDVLFHLPFALVDRTARPSIAEAPLNEVSTLTVTVGRSPPRAGAARALSRRDQRRDGRDPSRLLQGRATGCRACCPSGHARDLGPASRAYEGQLQMPHPDYVLAPEDAGKIPPLEPIYPLSAGVTTRMAKLDTGPPARAPVDLPEWQDRHLLAREEWQNWHEARSACIIRGRGRRLARRAGAAPASPMTNYWPISSPSASCGRGCGASAEGRSSAPAPCRRNCAPPAAA